MPKLDYIDFKPKKYTAFFKIDLEIEKPYEPQTAIYVPQGYEPTKKPDIILYLHGHDGKQIADTLRMAPYAQLRQDVTISNRDVIMVAPTLGPKSAPGKLGEAGGGDWYIDQVLEALGSDGPYKDGGAPELGRLILACHSGGGKGMLAVATQLVKYRDNLKECWGFDCMYNDGYDSAWANWAASRPSAALYIHFADGTANLSQKLASAAKAKDLMNVYVGRSTTNDHYRVPITHWRERISGSRYLQRH